MESQLHIALAFYFYNNFVQVKQSLLHARFKEQAKDL